MLSLKVNHKCLINTIILIRTIIWLGFASTSKWYHGIFQTSCTRMYYYPEMSFVLNYTNRQLIVPEQWVFGEYEAATKEVQRLDAATLLPITRKWFRLGTTIWFDMWRVDNILDHNGYEHQTVNHKPCRSHVGTWSNEPRYAPRLLGRV